MANPTGKIYGEVAVERTLPQEEINCAENFGRMVCRTGKTYPPRTERETLSASVFVLDGNVQDAKKRLEEVLKEKAAGWKTVGVIKFTCPGELQKAVWSLFNGDMLKNSMEYCSGGKSSSRIDWNKYDPLNPERPIHDPFFVGL